MMTNKKEEDLFCHYSGLPSPLAYEQCTDYDGIGNQGRIPLKKVLTKNNDKSV